MSGAKAVLSVFLLVNVHLLVNAQYYNAPVEPVRNEVVTSTTFLRETNVHTVWLTSTSDVIVTENSVAFHTVTQFTTNRDFVKDDERTVVSVLKVTNTPVIVRTVEVGQNSVRSLYSVVTSCATTTQTVNLWSTITHVQVQHQVRTVPVYQTETFRQRVLQTSTQFITVTVTSTTRGYY